MILFAIIVDFNVLVLFEITISTVEAILTSSVITEFIRLISSSISEEIAIAFFVTTSQISWSDMSLSPVTLLIIFSNSL